jgi:hypothetical protein
MSALHWGLTARLEVLLDDDDNDGEGDCGGDGGYGDGYDDDAASVWAEIQDF